MTDPRKSIVHQLDRAAARAEDAGQRPASSKQTWYLAGLLLGAGHDADWCGCGALDHGATLTSRDASGYIDMLIRETAALAA